MPIGSSSEGIFGGGTVPTGAVSQQGLRPQLPPGQGQGTFGDVMQVAGTALDPAGSAAEALLVNQGMNPAMAAILSLLVPGLPVGKAGKVSNALKGVPLKKAAHMSPQELRAAAELDEIADSKMITEIFGEEGAKRYKTLLRKETNIDPKVADAASAERVKMEDLLTEQQQSALFGFDVPEGNLVGEDLRRVAQEVERMSSDIEAGDIPFVMHTVSRALFTGGLEKDPAALLGTLKGLQGLQEAGVDMRKVVEQSAMLASREGLNLEDAAALIVPRLQKLQEFLAK